MERIITKENIEAYCIALAANERASGTIAKYRRDIGALERFLDGEALTRERAAEWKNYLQEQGYASRTINSMLASANGFFRHIGLGIRLKYLNVQRQMFREERRELSREEYKRLQEGGQKRLALIMETLCGTGIRISELQYITVEAAKAGRTTIALKGKIRTILLSEKLCRKLLK